MSNIGIRLIGQRKLDLAVNCLNHIESCVASKPDDENARNYLIGLAAHLYHASASARQRVQDALSPLYRDQQERAELQDRAIQMYLRYLNYATADMIGAFE
ncbi:MAG: hypothetical protein FJ042_08430 [Candidatus Cloacimonetes bacterium]|nr:hypothetical protein [Candidatus Cloacimonadota bacterium]